MAFHPYPQLIRAVCNLQRFGLPRGFTPASPWSWIDHPASGLFPVTSSPYSDLLSLRLRIFLNLATKNNSLAHYTKGMPSLWSAKIHASTNKADHRAPTDCKHMVSGSISLPSLGFFSLFPHGTGSLSVESVYLALGGGPPRFPQDFSCPVVLGNNSLKTSFFSPTGLITFYGQVSHLVQLRKRFLSGCLHPSIGITPLHP